MKNLEKEILHLKYVMHKGMLHNFKTNGYLTPMLFILRDTEIETSIIPMEFFKNSSTKKLLAARIRSLCLEPNVYAIGMILEASMKSVKNTDPAAEGIENGKKTFKDINAENKDIIMMNISTPEKEELIGYFVDPAAKTVGKSIPTGDEAPTGIFSDFFKWTKN